MKIRPVAVELFLADRRTDRRDEANSRFSQVCERAYTTRPPPHKEKINSNCRKSFKSAKYLREPNIKNSEVEIKYERNDITQTLQSE